MVEETLVRFSLKEAVYKALHPYVHRRIGFKEIEVYLHSTSNTVTIVPLNIKCKDGFSLTLHQEEGNGRQKKTSFKLENTSFNQSFIDNPDGKIQLQYVAEWIRYNSEYCISAVRIWSRKEIYSHTFCEFLGK